MANQIILNCCTCYLHIPFSTFALYKDLQFSFMNHVSAAAIETMPYVTQIREIAQQCGVDFPGMRGGRDSDDDREEDEDDDDTIPELPDEIDTDVGELRGGPFNYGNSNICDGSI